ncbi:MAG TPA: ATP-binding cassette domain-containing protein [Planctomycetes bacterium]|nr:ATP-binding cassette domain-containing protein [Planctomycetota bacterium]
MWQACAVCRNPTLAIRISNSPQKREGEKHQKQHSNHRNTLSRPGNIPFVSLLFSPENKKTVGYYPGENVLQIQGIRKSFGQQILFEDAGCLIEAGEKVGLVGANGHGKSTLLKMILHELEPDDGLIAVQRGRG